MKIDVSTLMDGELDNKMATAVIAKLYENKELQESWQTYHAIGDLVRENHVYSATLQERIFARLVDEPTVLAPRKQAVNRASKVTLAVAASVATVSVVAWMASSDAPAPQLPTIAGNAEVAQFITPASLPNANEYLLAHQEFSPNAGVYRLPRVNEGADKAP